MAKKNTISLLEKWQRRIRAAHKAHYYEASKLEKKQKNLGIIVVCLTTLVGTSVFTSLAKEYQVITGLLSVSATIFAALQTYLNYSEKRTAHLMASTQLSSIKKRIEGVLVTESTDEKLKEFIEEIRKEWDSTTTSAPLLSQDAFSKKVMDSLDEEDFEV